MTFFSYRLPPSPPSNVVCSVFIVNSDAKKLVSPRARSAPRLP